MESAKMAQNFEDRITVSRPGESDTIIELRDWGNIRAGGHGEGGDLILDDEDGNTRIWFEAGKARFFVRDADGEDQLSFDGRRAYLRIGAHGNEGDLDIVDGNDKGVFRFNASRANLHIGADGNYGDILVNDDAGETTVHIHGNSGDIKLRGADTAEHFDTAGGVPDPGTVMVIGPDGQLEPSTTAYDPKVAGIVSGAGDLGPGVVLGYHPDETNGVPIALSGRAWCRVDSDSGIHPGDLITTSEVDGHAMPARDPDRRMGAILGKALEGHGPGRGQVPVLVSLH